MIANTIIVVTMVTLALLGFLLLVGIMHEKYGQLLNLMSRKVDMDYPTWELVGEFAKTRNIFENSTNAN